MVLIRNGSRTKMGRGDIVEKLGIISACELYLNGSSIRPISHPGWKAESSPLLHRHLHLHPLSVSHYRLLLTPLNYLLNLCPAPINTGTAFVECSLSQGRAENRRAIESNSLALSTGSLVTSVRLSTSLNPSFLTYRMRVVINFMGLL